MNEHRAMVYKGQLGLASVAQLVDASSRKTKSHKLIPGQGTYLGCGLSAEHRRD